MSNILIIGKIPPPIGGVTTFVLRQITHMKKKGNNVDLFPLFSLSDINVLINILLHRYDSYQLNAISLPILIFFMLTCNLRKVDVVDHNHSRHFTNNLVTKLKLWLLRHTNKVCLVDKHLKSNYPTDFINFDVINPFLPPTESERSNAVNNIPHEIKEFTNDKGKIIVLSAWRYIEEDGIELYGLNQAVNSFLAIESKLDGVGVVICIGDSTYNTDKIKALKSLATSSKNIVFWEGCSASWVLFTSNTLYLRPTSTDGNSISIHEALYFQAKVLASDVVDRPDGCTTYQYRNNQDLQNQILNILE
jgi:hypothetical protein